MSSNSFISALKSIKNTSASDALFTRFRVDKKYRPNIGKYTYGLPIIMDSNVGGSISIGDFCSFASGVVLMLGGEHRTDWVSTYPFASLFKQWPETKAIKGHPRVKGNITIKNDVWVGHEALILSGVTISDGAVIGARSVVTKDVPPYAIVAGSPAKIIRYRFSQEQIEKLLSIKWWSWPINKINENVSLLSQPDIQQFIKAQYKKSV